MGPKPKPTKIKELQGTTRSDRLNLDEPYPEIGRPRAPDHLSVDALEEWNNIVDELVNLGIMTRIDTAALAAYCQAYGRWADAERKIQQSGLIIKTSNGNVVQNPFVGIANRSMEIMHKFLSEFGMTPSSRTRVKAQHKDTGDGWEQFGN